MATGALNAQGVWIYGEDDSEPTFSGLLNKLGNSITSNMKGRILKTQYASTNVQVNNSTSTPVSIGLSINYTPISSSSRILVFTNVNGIAKASSSIGTAANLRLRKDSTVVVSLGINLMFSLPDGTIISGLANVWTETSGSTTARTYSVFIEQVIGAGQVQVQRDGATSTMLIVEVSE